MIRTYNITITKKDNGFTVDARPDEGKGRQLVAKDEKEVQDLVTDIAAHLFDPPQKPTIPQPPVK